MSAPDDLPEAGWYPDPYEPSRVRYWDGEEWTDHYAPPPPEYGSGRFGDIGTWLGNSFRAIGADGLPVLAFAFVWTVVVTTIFWIFMRWAFVDLVYDNEEIDGEWFTVTWRFIVGLVVAILAEGISFLVLNRFMQRSHMGADPSLGEAMSHAMTRLGAWVRATILIGLGIAVAATVYAVVVALVPDLFLLLTLLLIAFALWAFVKLMFVAATIVAAPPGTPPIRTSANVSKGKFWAVLGRVVLLSLILGVGGLVWGGIFGGLEQPLDQEALVTLEAGDRLEFSTILPRFPDYLPAILVGAVASAFTALITTSAYMRLYLDSGAAIEPLLARQD